MSSEEDVLEDLEIARHEYEDAVAAYVACMDERGMPTAAVEQGGYYVYGTSGAVDDAVDADCRAGTIELIEPIYVERLLNPERIDMAVAIRECLLRHGVVEGWYSQEQFERDLQAGFESAPFDGEDPLVDGCMANPTR